MYYGPIIYFQYMYYGPSMSILYLSENVLIFGRRENLIFEREKKKKRKKMFYFYQRKKMFSKVLKGNNLNNSRERKGVIR